MRASIVLLLFVTACGKDGAATKPEPARPPPPADAAVAKPAPVVHPPNTYADLPSALAAIIPADARVLGFGEIHSRVDRAQVRSSLAHFTAALPAFGDKVSDLVLETFIVDPNCGKQAQVATRSIETEVKRPEATKSEIALLADAAKAAKIQPHAMKLSCTDYKTLVPKGEVDPLAMLTITTRELKRIAASAVAHRDKEAQHRPWIIVYGGALHNDVFPEEAVEQWSYAEALERVTKDHYVEIDLLVPELAEADPQSNEQSWYSLVEKAADRVAVYERDKKSFVVMLPRSPPPKAAPPAPAPPPK